jgi:HEAT repeat protein
VDYTKTIAEVLRYDGLARQNEQRLLDSTDRAGVSRAVTSAASALLDEPGEQSDLGLARLAGLLGRIATAEAARALIEMLGSTRPAAVQAAGEALTDIGDVDFDILAPAVREVLAAPSPGEVVEDLALVLADIDHPGAIDLVLEMLCHPSAQVVVAALEVAGELGWDRRIWDALQRLTGDHRAATVLDEDDGEVVVAISELAAEVVDTLRAMGRTEDE